MLGVVLCVLASIAGARAFEHGNVAALPQTCKTRFDAIFEKHYSIDVLPGTMNCTEILTETLDNQSGVNCSSPEDIRGCFNVSLLFGLITLSTQVAETFSFMVNVR